MLRNTVIWAAALIFILPAAGQAALQPVLEKTPEAAWPSVGGGPTGNPVVDFDGDLVSGRVSTERYTSAPSWIVSEDFDDDGFSEIVVQFRDGTMRVLSLSTGRLRTVSTSRKMAPGAAPLVVDTFDGQPTGGIVAIDEGGDLVAVNYSTGRARRLAGGFSTQSFPTAADLDGEGDLEIAAVSDEGSMTIVKGRIQTRSDDSVRLLPDTRLTVADLDGDGALEIAALSRPTDAFTTGRLGDDIEARGLAVFNWDGRSLRLRGDFELPSGQYFETLAAMPAGGGTPDGPSLILPVTEEGKGTQLRTYSYSRGRVREGRKGPVSDADQWIHILGSSVLGDSDRGLLITSLTEEGGAGDAELYRLDLARTRITLGSAASTHVRGSRLLEVSLIGDFNRDGQREFLAPGREMSSLALFSLSRNRLKREEIYFGSSRIGSNLCPGDFNGDGRDDVAFGLEDGSLVIIQGN